MEQVLLQLVFGVDVAENNRACLRLRHDRVYPLILGFQHGEVYPNSVQQSIHRDQNR